MLNLGDSKYLSGGILDSDAIDRVMLDVPYNGCVVMIPNLPRNGVILRRPILIGKYGMTLRGECATKPYFGRCATEFRFPPGVSGVVFQGSPAAEGELCNLEGVCLTSLEKAKGSAVGITINGAGGTLKNVGVYGFGGDACFVNGNSTAGTNADLFAVEHSVFASCGGSGLHIRGNVSNAGVVEKSSFRDNKGYGVWEESGTLGNTYLGCHASGNGLGPYYMGSQAAFSTFVGPYAEKGQGSIHLGPNCVGIGGANTYETFDYSGQHIDGGPYGLRVGQFMQSLPIHGSSGPLDMNNKPIVGVAGQVVVLCQWGFQKLVWYCITPGNWMQRVQ